MSTGEKIAGAVAIFCALAASVIFSCLSVLDGSDYFMTYNLVICALCWMLYLSTGVVEKEAKLNNQRFKMDKKNWFYYLPFTHHDYVRSLYISWLEMFAFVCICNVEYWAVIFISGKEPINTGVVGFVAFCIYVMGAITGLYVMTSQFGFGKVYKVVTMIGRILGWIFYCFTLLMSFEALGKFIPHECFDIFKPFCTPFSLLGVILIPALVFGIMGILLACDKKCSWTHN